MRSEKMHGVFSTLYKIPLCLTGRVRELEGQKMYMLLGGDCLRTQDYGLGLPGAEKSS